MPTQDRFFVAILAGVALLVVVAFAVALTRTEPAYRTDDSPDAVAFNYLLALQKGDHERAYGLLSPSLPGYPATVEDFVEDVALNLSGNRDRIANTVFSIQETVVTAGVAVVLIRGTRFEGNGLFDTRQLDKSFNMTLRDEAGGWKVRQADRFGSRCWADPGVDGCRRPVVPTP